MNKDKILRQFTVKQQDTLLNFLLSAMKDCSRTTVKSYLTHRVVHINDVVITKHDTPLNEGDTVIISRERGVAEFKNPMLEIVFEDEYIIVVNKKQGLLSMATNKEKMKTAYTFLSTHVKKADPQNRIFIVHRLDRETSGLMVFAKSEKVQELFQRNWKQAVLDRRYVAVIEGKLPEKEGTIEARLTQSPALKMYVSNDKNEGEMAITHYKTLRYDGKLSLVELHLETGKKNQIRAHLDYMKCPISGDKKYGAKHAPAGRVCLHASRLHIKHPITGVEHNFETKIPSKFQAIVRY